MALDEPNENDTTFDIDKLKIVVNSTESSMIGEVEIDYKDNGTNSGFSVKTADSGSGSCC